MKSTVRSFIENRSSNLSSGMLIKVVLFAVLFFFSCEPTDYSDEECCWYCTIETTYYYPNNNPYEYVTYEKYFLCDKTDEQIKAFETQFTYDSVTVSGIEYERIGSCRK